MILGGGPDHGWTTDVDVFDGGLKGHRRVCHRLAEGIEVHHHHIDGSDALGGQIGLVTGLVATGQDAAVNPRMQGLDPAPEDLRGSGVLSHLGDGQSGGLQGRSGTAAGDQGIARLQQSLGQGHQPLLVGHTEKGRGRHGCRTAGLEPTYAAAAPPP